MAAAGRTVARRTLDRLRHVPREVGFEVVEDHHVPRAEFRDQHLIHIGLERLRVGRPGENQRRPYPIQAQGSDHGRRTPRGGHRALGPLTPPCPGVGRRHRRVDPRLVDENQPFCLDSPHLRPVSPPLGLALRECPARRHAGSSSCRSGGSGGGCARGSSGCRRSRPSSFSCFRVASGCSAIRIASRTRSGKPRAGRGPPPWGLGAKVPASRRLWTNRVTNETLTRNRLAT